MYRYTVLFGVLLGLARGQQPPATNAPVTTLEFSAQRMLLHHNYAAPIGADTSYLQLDGSTTKVYPSFCPSSASLTDPAVDRR